MKGLDIKLIRYPLIFLGVLILAGCVAAPRQALFLSDSFWDQSIEEIVVLPVIDLRFNKEPELPKLDKWAQRIIKAQLKSKKYTFTFVKDRSTVDKITEEDLEWVDAEWVRNLGAPGSRWVFVVVLLDARSKLTLGSTGNAEVTGYLLDREYGAILWRDKGIGSIGQGGLAGMAMKGIMIRGAIEEAILSLMRSLPENWMQ